MGCCKETVETASGMRIDDAESDQWEQGEGMKSIVANTETGFRVGGEKDRVDLDTSLNLATQKCRFLTRNPELCSGPAVVWEVDRWLGKGIWAGQSARSLGRSEQLGADGTSPGRRGKATCGDLQTWCVWLPNSQNMEVDDLFLHGKFSYINPDF